MGGKKRGRCFANSQSEDSVLHAQKDEEGGEEKKRGEEKEKDRVPKDDKMKGSLHISVAVAISASQLNKEEGKKKKKEPNGALTLPSPLGRANITNEQCDGKHYHRSGQEPRGRKKKRGEGQGNEGVSKLKNEEGAAT